MEDRRFTHAGGIAYSEKTRAMTVLPESAAPTSAQALDPGLASLFARLYAQSGAAQFAISADEFTTILREIGAHYPDGAAAEQDEFYSRLQVADLVLARGCAAGDERAWEVFLTRFRARLYEIAGAIAREDSAARELADSVYAELYGLPGSTGERRSKFLYYSGRGSLEGWLRTVLAQQHVNRHRARRPVVSFEEQAEAGAQFAAPATETPAEADPRLAPAIDSALDSLDAEERFLVASYYLDGRTLAQVAQMVGVHESTISRRLERVVRSLRRAIVRELAARGMSPRQAEEALEADVRDLAVDVRAHLGAKPPPAATSELPVQESPPAAFSRKDTS